MFKESVEYNISTILPELSKSPVTGSAFTQARYKVKHEAFKELCNLTRDTYLRVEKELWKEHTLLAGDGSTLNLPPSKDIEKYFGTAATNDLGVKRYLARVFFIYDVLNEFVVGYNIGTMSVGEKPSLMKCLNENTIKNSVLLLDRGFGNYCTIFELTERNQFFCIRLPINNSNFAKMMLKKKGKDSIAEWLPSQKEKGNSKANKPVKVRVVKVRLDTGETELLVTNLLDYKKYSTKDFSGLYQLRWKVEEAFKNFKPKMKVEQFGCRKTEGVFQEFFAHVFCLNMIALSGIEANKIIVLKTKHRRLKYKYNWKNAYRFFRSSIIKFLASQSILQTLNQLINQITNSITAIKPDRKFMRDLRHKNKRGRITQFNK